MNKKAHLDVVERRFRQIMGELVAVSRICEISGFGRVKHEVDQTIRAFEEARRHLVLEASDYAGLPTSEDIQAFYGRGSSLK